MLSWRKVWVGPVMVAQSLWAWDGESRARFMTGEQGTPVVSRNGSCITGYEKKVHSCEKPSARAEFVCMWRDLTLMGQGPELSFLLSLP